MSNLTIKNNGHSGKNEYSTSNCITNWPYQQFDDWWCKPTEQLVYRPTYTYSLISHSSMAEVLENDDQYLMTAELPGFKDEEIDISYENGILSIKAKKTQKAPWGYRTKYFGSKVPQELNGSYFLENININKAVATFENGILTITVPKTEDSKPRKIKISK